MTARQEVEITIKLRTDSDGDTQAVEEFISLLSNLIDYTVFDKGFPAISYRFVEAN